MHSQASRTRSLFIISLLAAISALALIPFFVFAAGTWTNKAPLPSAKNGPVAGAIDGKLYVAGGIFGGDCPSLATLKIYDSATDTWSDGASMPGPRHSASAAVINGKLYVAGGSSSACSDPGNASLFEYNPVSNTWATKASMPTPRVGAGAATIDGKLYVLGGANGGGPLNTFQMYDPNIDAWTTKASFPTGISGLVMGAVDGKIYAAGGFTGASVTAALWEYDPVANTWTSRAPLPDPAGRYGSAGGVIDGVFYVSGGGNTFNTDTLFAYDAAADSWTIDEPMGEVRGAHAAAVIDGKLYVVGGTGTSGLDHILSLKQFEPTAVPPTTGTLIVQKVVVNSASTTNQFAFLVNGGAVTPFEADGENALELPAGIYNINERFQLGFIETFNNCKDVVLDAGETETCTITNTAWNVPIISGDTTGTVTVGATSNTSGQMTGDQDRLVWTVVDGANINPSASFSYAIDNLKATVNGSTLFDDPFDVAPPLFPSGFPGLFGIAAGGTWSASGGRAFMDQSGAIQAFSPINLPVGDALIQEVATFLTNFNASSPGGLRSNNDFNVEGKFDLIIPTNLGSSYAMVLLDGGNPNLASQSVLIFVAKTAADGVVRVRFAVDNQNTRERVVIGETILAPAPGDDQIVFRFEHVAGTHEVTGSFDLLSGGGVTSLDNILGVAPIFDIIDIARIVLSGVTPGTLESQRAGTYGTLTVNEGFGVWNYELGVTPAQQAAIAALADGSSANDAFSARAAHGNVGGPAAVQPLVITVEKPTPAQAIENLTITIDDMGLPAGVANSLSASLNNINVNNTNAACGKLDAFVDKVNDKLLSGELTQAEADQLLQAAGYIQTSLGC